MNCPTADSGNDGDLASISGWSGKSAGVANIFTSHEDTDMLSDFALLGCHAISNPGITRAQRLQRFVDSLG